MRAVKRFRGGEAVEVDRGAGPCKRAFRPPASARERRSKRDAAVGILAGLLPRPRRPYTAIEVAEAFGLSRQHASRIIARLRSELEGRRDG